MKQIYSKCQMIVLTTILTIAFSFNAHAQDTNNNNLKDQYNLFGKVKSLRVLTYEAIESSGTVKKGKLLSSEDCGDCNSLKTFNLQGNEIECQRYDLEGDVVYKYTYKYDDNNNQIEYNTYIPNGVQEDKITYKYDDKDNLTEHIWYKSGSMYKKSTFIYFENNELKEEYQYNDEGILVQKISYKYDKNNNPIETFFEEPMNFSETKYIHKYDEVGNKIETKIYDDGKLYKKSTYKYDKGRKVEKKDFNSSEKLDHWSVTITDKNGYLKEYIIYNTDGTFKNKYTYKNDKKGNSTKNKTYHSDGKQIGENSTEYEYDNKGNWIKRIEYEDGVPYSVTERKIKYFN